MADTADRSSPGLPDIPSSPPLPPQVPHSRKRHLIIDDYDIPSSDPLFSEDVSEADVSEPRRKRQVRGPWWQHNHARATARSGAKFADSGVWLNSESSDDGILRSMSHEQHERGSFAARLGFPVQIPDDLPSPVPASQSLPSPEELAARIVINCVEEGDERIDLSGMELPQLPSEAIRPLYQLIRAIDNPDSDSFAPLAPNLQIYLSNNDLKELPSALWDLDNITVLSLRNNFLKELPEAIGRLRKLKELNIAGNEIRWLPWELLDFIAGKSGIPLRLTLRPNPILTPVETLPDHGSRRQSKVSHSDMHQLHEDRVAVLEAMASMESARIPPSQAVSNHNTLPVFCASSSKTYFEIDGSKRRDTSAPSSNEPETWEATVASPVRVPGHVSKAQSLFELASKAVRTNLTLLDVASMSWKDSFEPIRSVMALCHHMQHRQLPSCSVCNRQYLFKRAEWIEYWHCNVSPDPGSPIFEFLPFMRRACSWGCAESAGSCR